MKSKHILDPADAVFTHGEIQLLFECLDVAEEDEDPSELNDALDRIREKLALTLRVADDDDNNS